MLIGACLTTRVPYGLELTAAGGNGLVCDIVGNDDASNDDAMSTEEAQI